MYTLLTCDCVRTTRWSGSRGCQVSPQSYGGRLRPHALKCHYYLKTFALHLVSGTHVYVLLGVADTVDSKNHLRDDL